MSQYGIKAAEAIAKDLPSSGDWLAADLCNAVTPAQIVAAQLRENSGNLAELAEDLQTSIDLVMSLVRKLRGE